MIISGANLENTEVEYKRLSEVKWTDSEEINKQILYLEKLYLSLYEKARETEINPIEIDNDNRVVVKPYMAFHRSNSDLNTLRMISEKGILATEWFGLLESEREGCFCTFISRIKRVDYPYLGDLAEDNYSRLNVGNNVLLFLDQENPIMKYLVHLDYFDYIHLKNTNPDCINEKYTIEEIDLLDKLIAPISPSGKGMRVNHDFKTNYWSAIPGGIPPFLVNGICIKNVKYTDEELENISMMFPKAIIFNSKKEIARHPYFLMNFGK